VCLLRLGFGIRFKLGFSSFAILGFDLFCVCGSTVVLGLV